MESVESVDPSRGSARNAARGVRERAEDLRWTVSPGWEAVVTGPAAPDWSDLSCDSRAELVKSNALRRVWRVRRGARALFVKEHDHSSMRAGLRHRLRGSAARIEFRAGLAAAARGVACVPVVAQGHARGRSFLVTEALPGAVALADAWRRAVEAGNAADLDALTRATADLLARAHDRGFVHGDDHPRNILISCAGGGAPHAVYVDVAGARVARRVCDRAAADSLGQLNQWFRLRSDRRRRLRFLWIYCRARARGCADAARALQRRLSPLVFARTHAQAAKLWAKRDGRILRSNRYFARITRPGGGTAHVALRVRGRDVFPVSSLPDATVEQWQAHLDAWGAGLDSGDVSVTTVRSPALQTGLAGRLKRRLAGSPLRRAFVMGHRLRHRDLPCRRPVAWLTRGDGMEVLWSEAQPQVEPMMRWLLSVTEDIAARRRMAASVARVVALMSDRGASLAPGSEDTFGVTVDGATAVLIERPTQVVLRKRAPDRDVFGAARVLYESARRAKCFRRTDAVCFLKTVSPTGWKALWRRVGLAVRSGSDGDR